MVRARSENLQNKAINNIIINWIPGTKLPETNCTFVKKDYLLDCRKF